MPASLPEMAAAAAPSIPAAAIFVATAAERPVIQSESEAAAVEPIGAAVKGFSTLKTSELSGDRLKSWCGEFDGDGSGDNWGMPIQIGWLTPTGDGAVLVDRAPELPEAAAVKAALLLPSAVGVAVEAAPVVRLVA